MTDYRLHKSIVKSLKNIILSGALTSVGVILIILSESKIESVMGYVCTIFFGLVILFGIFNLFDRRPQIIIKESGIWDRTTNQNEIRWDQIKGIKPVSIFGQDFISLDVDNSFISVQKTYNWASRINRGLGASDLNLNIGHVNYKPRKMIQFFTEIIQAKPSSRIEIITKYFDKKSTNANIR